MKTTCLINNFNYKDYVCEAIDSALSQTHPFDEIIIVDDTSTDGSNLILQEQYAQNPHVKIIIHPHNQGQLAAVTTGFLQSTGDIIFFLDADDFYHPQYLEIALNIYRENPNCGFLYCQMGIFSKGKENYQAPTEVQISQYQNYLNDRGYSIILAMEMQRFVGSPSSGNSMQRKYLSDMLPCTCIGNYRIWADTYFVIASSILGAHKFLINLPLVAYRVHDKNIFYSNSITRDRFKVYQDQLATVQFITFLSQKMNYNRLLLARNAPYEFKTIDSPNWDLFFDYLKIMLRTPASVPFTPNGRLSKLHGFAVMLKHILSFQKSSKR